MSVSKLVVPQPNTKQVRKNVSQEISFENSLYQNIETNEQQKRENYVLINFKEAQIKKIEGKVIYSINPFLVIKKKNCQDDMISRVSYVSGLYPQWDLKTSIKLDQLDENYDFKIYLKRKESCHSNKVLLVGDAQIKIMDFLKESNKEYQKVIQGKQDILYIDKWIELSRKKKNKPNKQQMINIGFPTKTQPDQSQIIMQTKNDEQRNTLTAKLRVQILLISLQINESSESKSEILDLENIQDKGKLNKIWQKHFQKVDDSLVQNLKCDDINQCELKEKEIKRKKWILYPDDRKSIIWNDIVGIFIFISLVCTPLNLAFRNKRIQNQHYSNFLYVIDAVFILDVFINFITAYEDNQKNIRAEFKDIAKNYYRTWLFVDLFSILPFDLIFIYGIPYLKLSDSYNRILKTLKFFHIQKLFDQVENYLLYIQIEINGGSKKHSQTFKKYFFLVTFTIKFVLVCHVIACVWIFVGKESLFELIETNEGSYTDFSTQNWLTNAYLSNATEYQKYTASFYFTVTTMTTVGYGDISGHNSLERIICVFIMIIGVVVFSIVSGQILAIIQSQDQDEAEAKGQIELMKKFQLKYKISDGLYSELVRQSKDEAEFDVQEQINEYVIGLPKNLQVKIYDQMYDKIFCNLYFFQNKPNKFIQWIYPLLKQETLDKDEYFCIFNEEIESISFLHQGETSLIIPLSENKKFISLGEGQNLGNLNIFQSCIQSQTSILGVIQKKENLKTFFTFQAQTDCTVFHLSVDMLQEMSEKFPEAFDSLFIDSDIRSLQLLQNYQRVLISLHQETFNEQNANLKDIFADQECNFDDLNQFTKKKQSQNFDQLSIRSIKEKLKIQYDDEDSDESEPLVQKRIKFEALIKLVTEKQEQKDQELIEIDDQIQQDCLYTARDEKGTLLDQEKQLENMQKIDKLLLMRYIVNVQQKIKDIQNYQSKYANIEERRASYLAKGKKQEQALIETNIQDILKYNQQTTSKIDMIIKILNQKNL